MKTTITKQNIIRTLIIAIALFMGANATAQQCSAGFTYSVGQNGQVTFSSTCTGTTQNTQIMWNFGPYFSPQWANGPTAVSTNTTGNYNYVCIYATDSLNNNYCSFCDTVILQGNPCNASVSISMSPDSSQVLTWNAWAYYDMNVTGATWNWGDGSSTNGLYPSHTYSAAGLYNVCVTETVQCGATSSVCNNYNIYKSANQNNAMITVHVKNPYTQTTGLNANTKESIKGITMFPNPTNDKTFITLSSSRSGVLNVSIYDITGALISEKQETLLEGNNKLEVQSKDLNRGFYIVTLRDGTGKKSMRLIKD